jgi:hypothetical protein
MKALAWVLVGALFAVVFAGCYTKLVHAPVMDDSGTYYHPRAHCSDCHNSADYYYYHFPYYSHYGYGSYRSWRGYYWDPWWYHDYWWWDSDEGGEPAGTTRYWNDRGRSDDVPKLAPPAAGTKAKDPKIPPTSDGGQSGDQGKKKDDSGSRYNERRGGSRQPEKKPAEPKKADEKKDAKEKR